MEDVGGVDVLRWGLAGVEGWWVVVWCVWWGFVGLGCVGCVVGCVLGVVWCVVWFGVVWCGVVCGVVWSGVGWCGLWCCVVWCGVSPAGRGGLSAGRGVRWWGVDRIRIVIASFWGSVQLFAVVLTLFDILCIRSAARSHSFTL